MMFSPPPRPRRSRPTLPRFCPHDATADLAATKPSGFSHIMPRTPRAVERSMRAEWPTGGGQEPTPSAIEGRAIQQGVPGDRHRIQERLHDEAAALGVADDPGHALGRVG